MASHHKSCKDERVDSIAYIVFVFFAIGAWILNTVLITKMFHDWVLDSIKLLKIAFLLG